MNMEIHAKRVKQLKGHEESTLTDYLKIFKNIHPSLILISCKYILQEFKEMSSCFFICTINLRR